MTSTDRSLQVAEKLYAGLEADDIPAFLASTYAFGSL